jgi:AcrR family transcriptional regulator
MEAAIHCLAHRGYARTTSRDLAAAAGANLAAITYHYGSKEELLQQALIEGFRRWFDGLVSEAVAAGGGPEAELVPRLAAGLQASFEANRGLAQAFLEALAEADHSPKLRRQLAKSYEDTRLGLVPLLGAAIDLEDKAASDLASGMIAIADGLLIQWLLDARATPSTTDVVAAITAAAPAQLASASSRRGAHG